MRISACLCLQQHVGVIDRTPHWTKNREGKKADGPPLGSHYARGWPDADNATEAGRCTQASAIVRSAGERHHASGQCHRRTARRSATCFGWIERIAGGAEYKIARVGAGTEFGGVGFAKNDPAGLADVGHSSLIPCRHMVGVEL